MTQPGNHLNKKGKLNNTKLYMIVERFKKDAPNKVLPKNNYLKIN
jgi:hypothetical protein